MELLVAWLPESDVSVVDVGLLPCMCWLNWSGSGRGRVTVVNESGEESDSSECESGEEVSGRGRVTVVNVRVVRRLVGGGE